MSNFWTSPSGSPITGSPDSAFLKDFTTIPEGTMALGTIKSFEVVTKAANKYTPEQKHIEVKYKLTQGDFKNREVTQKIKVFDGKPEQIERNLNMLKLIMDLCGYTPLHGNEPSNQELAAMNGRVLGIKIGEWSMPKEDGSGVMEGNMIREVHSSAGFECETGVKSEVVHSRSAVDTAFSRNQPKTDSLDDDIPF